MTPASTQSRTLQPDTQAFLTSGPKRLLIGGEWQPAANGQTFVTVNPATGEPLAEVAAGQQHLLARRGSAQFGGRFRAGRAAAHPIAL